MGQLARGAKPINMTCLRLLLAKQLPFAGSLGRPKNWRSPNDAVYILSARTTSAKEKGQKTVPNEPAGSLRAALKRECPKTPLRNPFSENRISDLFSLHLPNVKQIADGKKQTQRSQTLYFVQPLQENQQTTTFCDPMKRELRSTTDHISQEPPNRGERQAIWVSLCAALSPRWVCLPSLRQHHGNSCYPSDDI